MEYKPFKINKNMIEGMKKAFPHYEECNTAEKIGIKVTRTIYVPSVLFEKTVELYPDANVIVKPEFLPDTWYIVTGKE